MRILITLCLLLSLPQAALATPYRHVEIREQVLGQTDTHFFVLRHIGDNRGYHGTRQDEIYLISRDLLSGAEERTWPVMRSLDHGRYYFQNNVPQRFENLGAGERVNPYDILLWREAVNLNPMIYPMGDHWPHVQISGSDIVVSGPDGSSDVAVATVVESMIESLQDTHALLSGDGKGGQWMEKLAGELEWLRQNTEAVAESCAFTGQFHTEWPPEADIRPVLAQLTCRFEDEYTGGITYWAVLPPEKLQR